jgi:hypothetical protein
MSIWGFWAFGNKCGLQGAASTIVELPDGRMLTQPNAQNPAVLEDEFILFSVRNNLRARADFYRILPTLDDESQERLQNLAGKHRRAFRITRDEQSETDAIQHKQVTSGVHLETPKPNR